MYFSKYTVLSAEKVLAEFNSNLHGLTTDEANRRLENFGLNIVDGKELKLWQVFLRQFKSPFIYLLFFAAALAFGLKENVDGFMILGFIAINAILGFAQEYHSEKSLSLLKKYVVARARVHRNAKDNLVKAIELVPGDIIMIETGDVIPADIRLLEVDNLVIDESVLTGESVPMAKRHQALSKIADEIHKASNLGFSGTIVAGGRGAGVVIATGRSTFMGSG